MVNDKQSKKGLLVFFIFLIFLSTPYLLLLSKFSIIGAIDLDELVWSLQNSFAQALLSSIGTMVLGFFLASGMMSVPKARQKLVIGFVILPGLLPPLFLLLVVLAILNPFPIGIIGVSIIHILMNAGLVAILLLNLAETKLKSLAELCWVEGARRGQFIKAILGMVKRDLWSIFIFIFVICFTSFSVPLIAGGGRSTTLEVLIYEKIRISGSWGEALTLSLIQQVLVFLFTLNFLKSQKRITGRFQNLDLLKGRWGIVLLFLYCFVIPLIFVASSLSGIESVFKIPGLWESVLDLMPMTMMFSWSVGIVVFILFNLTLWSLPNEFLNRLLRGFVSPSTALLGFSLLFFLPNEDFWIWIKWIFGFSYLIFGTLYRWGWDQEVSGVLDQVQVAKTLGASDSLIFKEILFPQLIGTSSILAGIASLWAIGDFALGKIVVGQDLTLSMLIQTLMSSYRLEAAMALMLLLLVLGFFNFFIFWSFRHVYSRIS